MADMPQRIDEIISTVNEIAGVYARLQQAPDKDAADRLQASAADLTSIFTVIRDNAQRLVDSKNRGDALNKINNALTIEEAADLQQFFENVSTALIDAQKQLNLRSLDYVQSLDPRISPAHYVIPSVKAEMNVGFSQISQRGVNVILFTKSEQKQNYGESTVTMELVAAPPPPGLAPFGGFTVPIPRFVVLGDDRASLLARIQQQVPDLAAKSYENTKAIAVVLAYEKKDPADEPEYLVLWPAQSIGMINWAEIAIAHVRDKQSALEFDGTVFESPPKEGFLRISSLADLLKLDVKQVAPLTINLGDALWNVLLVINGWLDAVTRRPPAAPPNP